MRSCNAFVLALFARTVAAVDLTCDALKGVYQSSECCDDATKLDNSGHVISITRYDLKYPRCHAGRTVRTNAPYFGGHVSGSMVSATAVPYGYFSSTDCDQRTDGFVISSSPHSTPGTAYFWDTSLTGAPSMFDFDNHTMLMPLMGAWNRPATNMTGYRIEALKWTDGTLTALSDRKYVTPFGIYNNTNYLDSFDILLPPITTKQSFTTQFRPVSAAQTPDGALIAVSKTGVLSFDNYATALGGPGRLTLLTKEPISTNFTRMDKLADGSVVFPWGTPRKATEDPSLNTAMYEIAALGCMREIRRYKDYMLVTSQYSVINWCTDIPPPATGVFLNHNYSDGTTYGTGHESVIWAFKFANNTFVPGFEPKALLRGIYMMADIQVDESAGHLYLGGSTAPRPPNVGASGLDFKGHNAILQLENLDAHLSGMFSGPGVYPLDGTANPPDLTVAVDKVAFTSAWHSSFYFTIWNDWFVVGTAVASNYAPVNPADVYAIKRSDASVKKLIATGLRTTMGLTKHGNKLILTTAGSDNGAGRLDPVHLPDGVEPLDMLVNSNAAYGWTEPFESSFVLSLPTTFDDNVDFEGKRCIDDPDMIMLDVGKRCSTLDAATQCDENLDIAYGESTLVFPTSKPYSLLCPRHCGKCAEYNLVD